MVLGLILFVFEIRVNLEMTEEKNAEEDLVKLNIEPTKFNESTHNLLPSISPREALEYQEDTKLWKSQTRFSNANSLLYKFVILLQSEILRNKPDDILDYIVNDFFSVENIKNIKSTAL